VLVAVELVEQRYQVVLEVLNQGSTVTDVAVRLGVTRQMVHRWLRKYASEGIAGLADRSARPLSCPHQEPLGGPIDRPAGVPATGETDENGSERLDRRRGSDASTRATRASGRPEEPEIEMSYARSNGSVTQLGRCQGLR
jgi:transposase-like protein